ncbi:MAG: MarR family transcriptional regulator [Acidobacteria bacterium]|nr:MAG: MarR family transcriptional regulator [Acidobacteriota bacterium]PYQ21828.1 MAG: MarR family transcriptional regulator [Acidobacteriota bacterium]
MPEIAPPARVDVMRRFNRFYTRQIGLLQEGLLRSPFSLTEARVLYEIAHRAAPTASTLGRELGLDGGYLSRILRGFRRGGLVDRRPSPDDGRQGLLSLTRRGRAAFASLDERSRDEVGTMLGRLPASAQRRLIDAMGAIEELLGAPRPAGPASPYLLRSHQPGDMGWVVHRHGVLYAQEYGWDERFEALVAEIVARFVKKLDPKRERCWMAEMDGEVVGSVFLVKQSRTVARLRLMLVEPRARGMGIGTRLVGECVRFARQAGYGKITLWTNSVLRAARHIYQQAGFRLVHEEKHHSFGHDLVGETWDLKL